MSDESVFGDHEPEDSWDPGDPVPLLIENLLKRLDLLNGMQGRRGRLGELLDVVEARLRPWTQRKGTVSARDLVRIEQLEEDLAFLRGRDAED